MHLKSLKKFRLDVSLESRHDFMLRGITAPHDHYLRGVIEAQKYTTRLDGGLHIGRNREFSVRRNHENPPKSPLLQE
jgi:hypothetical protein